MHYTLRISCAGEFFNIPLKVRILAQALMVVLGRTELLPSVPEIELDDIASSSQSNALAVTPASGYCRIGTDNSNTFQEQRP
ncbi:protein of unknown function [Georgfuchsia toluolica]|uniref:Uncharacterized protein n=1 Tax=Georgfuchsia toluolica TaxID=424218 RepID=A0A916N9M5_9PROT|nr:hypothetical protein [Georgfuchsia toluolica]CAG4884787.1 protein of unknown function [Georgfuchsia toluolica]